MASPAEIKRRLVLLKAEVESGFEGLIAALEEGLQLVVMRNSDFGNDLDADTLRRIGGMVKICDHYGAVVIFAKGPKIGDLDKVETSNI